MIRLVMTSKRVIEENYDNLEKMGIEWIDPWEKPLHEIYNFYPCLSPIPSLAVHCANINSILTPVSSSLPPISSGLNNNNLIIRYLLRFI